MFGRSRQGEPFSYLGRVSWVEQLRARLADPLDPAPRYLLTIRNHFASGPVVCDQDIPTYRSQANNAPCRQFHMGGFNYLHIPRPKGFNDMFGMGVYKIDAPNAAVGAALSASAALVPVPVPVAAPALQTGQAGRRVRESSESSDSSDSSEPTNRKRRMNAPLLPRMKIEVAVQA